MILRRDPEARIRRLGRRAVRQATWVQRWESEYFLNHMWLIVGPLAFIIVAAGSMFGVWAGSAIDTLPGKVVATCILSALYLLMIACVVSFVRDDWKSIKRREQG